MIDPLTICLPTTDRGRAAAFYTRAFGLELVGEPLDDGLPEPLQLRLNGGALLMLIPRDGFEYTLAGAAIAAPEAHSSLLSITAGSEAEVDALFAAATEHGASVLGAPSRKPWGYVATLADPDGHPWLIRSP